MESNSANSDAMDATGVAPDGTSVPSKEEVPSTDATSASPAATAVPTPLAPVRPPNRPAHERYLEETATQLSALESRRRFLQDRLKGLREQMARGRQERDAITEERNQVGPDRSLICVLC